jgi:cytochrome c oxidase subunit IV
MDEAHEAPAAENHISVYNKIIGLLTLLTAVEFGLAFGMKPHEGGGEPMIGFVLGVVLLLALAAWKAVLVGKVFMHLKYDPRLLGWIAVSPVILGTPLVIIGLYDAIHGGAF